ncbi:NAD(P)/FAD-dependent oxidoreductase [Cyclobacteriaceae bacterium]|nr:NAD(P)/FAD-dependent oxidoreductase [Cyclobacteriaceae bacterium]
MKNHQILILGGGTGGIMVASKFLKEQKGLDIAIVEPSKEHWYQPAWTLVGAGTFDMNATKRPEKDYIPKRVKWYQNKVEQISPDQNQVTLSNGDVVGYEYLVVALGLENRPDLLDGLADTLGENNVCSNYVDPTYTYEVLKNFKGGNALFTHAPSVLKCPGAPQKMMYLAGEYFKNTSKVLDKTNVIYAFPGSVVFGVEPFKKRLYEINDERNTVLKHGYELVKIDGPNKVAYFKRAFDKNGDGGPITMHDDNNRIKETEENGLYKIQYEMLHLAPPQRPLTCVSNSKLAHTEGANTGWMNVDIHSLQSSNYQNVFGVGDIVALPTAKTGAAIRKQAPVVVSNILSLIKNGTITDEKYNGYSSCPLVVSYNSMLLAEFGYEGKRMSDPILKSIFNLGKENWFLWILKKYGLPYLYWNKMLKGEMMD